LSLAADLTTAVLKLDEAVWVGLDSNGRLMCAQLLLLLLEHLGAEACTSGTDTVTQLRQLQSVAYTLQLVEAVIRCQAASLAATPKALEEVGLCYACNGFDAASTALDLISRAGEAVLGSLQGQQLLQSCTSLLLTSTRLLHTVVMGPVSPRKVS
jgi:hypothetical protein